mgnify:CR=1 FL=1
MKKETQLLLTMICGLHVGNIIGSGYVSSGHLEWLGYNMVFGTTSPVVVDLGVISSTIGIQVYISVAGVISCVLALICYIVYEFKYL